MSPSPLANRTPSPSMSSVTAPSPNLPSEPYPAAPRPIPGPAPASVAATPFGSPQGLGLPPQPPQHKVNGWLLKEELEKIQRRFGGKEPALGGASADTDAADGNSPAGSMLQDDMSAVSFNRFRRFSKDLFEELFAFETSDRAAAAAAAAAPQAAPASSGSLLNPVAGPLMTHGVGVPAGSAMEVSPSLGLGSGFLLSEEMSSASTPTGSVSPFLRNALVGATTDMADGANATVVSPSFSMVAVPGSNPMLGGPGAGGSGSGGSSPAATAGGVSVVDRFEDLVLAGGAGAMSATPSTRNSAAGSPAPNNEASAVVGGGGEADFFDPTDLFSFGGPADADFSTFLASTGLLDGTSFEGGMAALLGEDPSAASVAVHAKRGRSLSFSLASGEGAKKSRPLIPATVREESEEEDGSQADVAMELRDVFAEVQPQQPHMTSAPPSHPATPSPPTPAPLQTANLVQQVDPSQLTPTSVTFVNAAAAAAAMDPRAPSPSFAALHALRASGGASSPALNRPIAVPRTASPKPGMMVPGRPGTPGAAGSPATSGVPSRVASPVPRVFSPAVSRPQSPFVPQGPVRQATPKLPPGAQVVMMAGPPPGAQIVAPQPVMHMHPQQQQQFHPGMPMMVTMAAPHPSLVAVHQPPPAPQQQLMAPRAGLPPLHPGQQQHPTAIVIPQQHPHPQAVGVPQRLGSGSSLASPVNPPHGGFAFPVPPHHPQQQQVMVQGQFGQPAFQVVHHGGLVQQPNPQQQQQQHLVMHHHPQQRVAMMVPPPPPQQQQQRFVGAPPPPHQAAGAALRRPASTPPGATPMGGVVMASPHAMMAGGAPVQQQQPPPPPSTAALMMSAVPASAPSPMMLASPQLQLQLQQQMQIQQRQREAAAAAAAANANPGASLAGAVDGLGVRAGAVAYFEQQQRQAAAVAAGVPQRPSSTPPLLRSASNSVSPSPSPLATPGVMPGMAATEEKVEKEGKEGKEKGEKKERSGRKDKYKCPKPYCSKTYKNLNGLKYHLERGNCELDSTPETAADAQDLLLLNSLSKSIAAAAKAKTVVAPAPGVPMDVVGIVADEAAAAAAVGAAMDAVVPPAAEDEDLLDFGEEEEGDEGAEGEEGDEGEDEAAVQAAHAAAAIMVADGRLQKLVGATGSGGAAEVLAAANGILGIKIARRPYWCRVEGCGKRYKNLNGLKYHAKVSHPEMEFKKIKGHKSQEKGAAAAAAAAAAATTGTAGMF
ncbi:hypothetical protein HDU96_008533 [Phlyctochytrium bullatum]|nr:hypothetical protein HDU96_008533 [Phlyctochytrium bullatum]